MLTVNTTYSFICDISVIFYVWDSFSVFIFSHVMWSAQDHLISENEMDLMSTPHFHLSGSIRVRGSIWVDDNLFYLNGSILAIHLSYNSQDLKSHLRSETSIHNRTDDIWWLSLSTRSCNAILMLCWRSNSHNLTIPIYLFGFHCNHWYHQGEDLTVTPNFKTL